MNGAPLDILIRGGILLPMTADDAVVADAAIGIRKGAIVFAGAADEHPLQDCQATEVVEAAGMVVMPGLVNTHTHLAMSCFRGMADDLPLMTWLNDHIFPAEARFVNRELVYHGSLLAMAEMVLSGTTTFCDGYFYPGQVGRAAQAMGMRGVVSAGVIDFPTPGNPDPSKNADLVAAFVEKWRRRSPLLAPAVFCHSPYTCGPETLSGAKKIARRQEVLFLTHLSETQGEVDLLRERYGKAPVRHLADLDVLDEQSILVHCNWLSDEEIRLLAERQARVSHNPESSMKLAAGVAPIPAFLRQGIAVGLGTDGAASNNDLDLFREMGTAARIHKLMEGDPKAMSARTVLRMATLEGARILGMADRIGTVEAGKRADVILVDLHKPHLTPIYDPRALLVYAASGADVATVIIDGRIVVRNRRLLPVDLDGLLAEASRIGAFIRKRLSPGV